MEHKNTGKSEALQRKQKKSTKELQNRGTTSGRAPCRIPLAAPCASGRVASVVRSLPSNGKACGCKTRRLQLCGNFFRAERVLQLQGDECRGRQDKCIGMAVAAERDSLRGLCMKGFQRLARAGTYPVPERRLPCMCVYICMHAQGWRWCRRGSLLCDVYI